MPTTISIDASVAIKAIIEEPHSGLARQIVSAYDLLLTPAHAYAEIAEVVLRKTQAGLIQQDQAAIALQRLPKILTMVALDTIMLDAFRIGLTLKHSVYDCLYIAAARLHGVKLITADKRLLAKTAQSEFAATVIDIANSDKLPV